jgi:hypothetical protein
MRRVPGPTVAGRSRQPPRMMFESKAVEVMAVNVCRCLQRSSIVVIPGRKQAREPRMRNGSSDIPALPDCDRER